MQLTREEEALLCNFEEDVDLEGLPNHVKEIWNGNWEGLAEMCVGKFVTVDEMKYEHVEDVIERATNGCEDNEIFSMGVACCLLFIQSNFTGPPIPETTVELLKTHVIIDKRTVLSVDTEEINVNAEHLELLLLAKLIFKYCRLCNNFVTEWWSLRTVMVHQVLLEDVTTTLFSIAETHVANLSNWAICNDRLKAKLLVEVSQMYLLCAKVSDAETRLGNAKELLGIDFELSGELGRRTRYQQRDIAQIKLTVQLNGDVPRPKAGGEGTKCSGGPNVVRLEDDVRLDGIRFVDEQDTIQVPAVEQTLILTTLQYFQRARPKDELLVEESEAYCSFLLRQNNPWAVRVPILLLRCRFESTHKRTIERALLQMESVCSGLRDSDPKPVQRISCFWAVGLPTGWQMKGQMADIMLSMGMVKSCLEIYQHLQLWEEVIVCYTILNLRHKAADVIKDQLEKNPTIKLWCLLGDATDDVSCYEKAWEMSDHRSSRAQRHWGQYYFSRKEYGEAIAHLEKSLEINPLQNMVLLRLGYSALNVNDWKLAATTYRKYTCIEPHNFESWNNLAKAYVKLGEKTRAHFALQEALKYSFENWRVWDNFMVVSADTSNFEDLVRAYHQILNIKEKHLDVDVLKILTGALVLDNEGKYTNTKLKSKTLELFGRLTSIYPGESRLWEMYADLSPSPELKAQRLYRAYRGLVQDDWSKDPVKCGKVLGICEELGEVALTADTASKSSARLTLRAAIAAAKRHNWEENAQLLKSVEDVLERITQTINNT